ncbi:hypothetical protein [Kribbella sindirgiensis]|uniref:Recombinase family protein n=1 Tax=Kribbella sindirgiensis TaxID=1124744 RepID=A0A4R0I3M5_9ACTN|nr:hypothetical protein [Kribbella sindirgiensis]TCC18678.1 hypothetical protein E0H50_38850 [Kribbella sindirgiensis]
MIIGNSSRTGGTSQYDVATAQPTDRLPGRERGQRGHTGGNCYSLTCNCEPADRKQAVRGPRAYAYVCGPLLICQPQVTRTRQQLASYAADAGLELAAVFVEEDWQCLSAFERLFHATIRDQVDVVLLPSMLHFTALGSPRSIKPSFEAVTGARIVTML